MTTLETATDINTQIGKDQLPIVLANLAAAVANLTAPQRTWWTLADIANEFQLHPATVQRKIVCRQDFPPPCSLTDSKRGEPRWRRTDVLDWAEGRQLPKPRQRSARKAKGALNPSA